MQKKRGLNLDLLDSVVNTLANGEKLPDKNHDHELIGEYHGFRECHGHYETQGRKLSPRYRLGTLCVCSVYNN